AMIEAAGFLVAAAALAVCRAAVIEWLNSERFPWGTLGVNVSGSFVAGMAVALAPESWSTIVGIGALGAFTTFSTFAVEVAALWPQSRGTAVAYGAATTALTIGAAAIGLGF
ncbi:MAG: fluoride efflux transporter FluC, partial [Microthrixaceae bacterium]